MPITPVVSATAASGVVTAVTCRELATLDDFVAAADLECLVWGYGDRIDAAPASLLSALSRAGAVLLGAYDETRLVGLVYSFPAIKEGRIALWSHRLGVLEAYRCAGVGERLKLLQRQRALDLGVSLIEWTYDPLQAVSAHLNFVKLGVIAASYELNAYGRSSSVLHARNPTDRFVVQWWLRDPEVMARLQGLVRTRVDATQAAIVNTVRPEGEWLRCEALDLSCSCEVAGVQIPLDFTRMLRDRPDLALQWRLATRSTFMTYLRAGYVVADFVLDPHRPIGTYVLTRGASPVLATSE